MQAECHNEIDMLFKEYKDNEYALQKIHSVVTNNLKNMIKKSTEDKIQRQKVKQDVEKEVELFVDKFMQQYKYYFAPCTELFFDYDGIHYNIKNEDEIYKDIFSEIPKSSASLMSQKHNIKYIILNKMKSNNILDAIPNSETIQNIINYLSPYLNKNKSKYFLCIIGDILHKKNELLIYIMPPKTKNFINNLSTQSSNFLGISNYSKIKYKYYDHDYEDCRLVMFDNYDVEINITSEFFKNMIDFFCVAGYYSNRYESSDGYIMSCNGSELQQHAWFLKNNTLENIINMFINESIETCHSQSISYKNMLYLWKKYLNNKNLPNVAFYQKFKEILCEKLTYNDTSDMFLNVTSKDVPFVKLFLSFWNENMTPNNDEFEIDEITTLFRKWLGKSIYQFDDDYICDIIKHFYPYILIKNDKYVCNIACKIWDKKDCIDTAINYYITNNKPIILEDIYKYYCTLAKPKNMIVSKQYFKKNLYSYTSKL